MGKTLWPAHLAAYYPHPIDTLPVWKTVLSAALLLVITAGAVRMRKSAPYLLMGWAWFVIVLAPASGLIQFGGHAMADRFSYVPLIGLFIAVAWMLPSALGRISSPQALKVAQGLLACLSVVVLLLCAIASHKQTGYWRSEMALWEHAVSVTQRNSMAHDCLGLALYDSGRYEDALAHYRLAAKYYPDFEKPACHITNTLVQLGRMDEALANAREAVKRFPKAPGEYLLLANIEASRGNTRTAIALLSKAVDIDPTNPLVLANYGTMLASQGNLREGVLQLKKALEYAPDSEEIQSNLAHFQQLLGEQESQ
jgi:protein O-mannosyl-transferase